MPRSTFLFSAASAVTFANAHLVVPTTELLKSVESGDLVKDKIQLEADYKKSTTDIKTPEKSTILTQQDVKQIGARIIYIMVFDKIIYFIWKN